MSEAMEIGAVSLRAQQRALEILANNIGNANTPGFKRDDVRFAEIVGRAADPISETERLATEQGSGGSGIRFTTRSTISEQGELRSTGNAMDIAVDGAGFVELLGPDGKMLLWRGGRLAVNSDGFLAGPEGFPLRALITLPRDVESIEIDRDGRVTGIVQDDEPIELGQIALVRTESDGDLERFEGGLYRLAEGARMFETEPGGDGAGFIMQGMIEGSNVEMTAAMVEMLMLQRTYSASAQIIQTADQIAAITNNLKR